MIVVLDVRSLVRWSAKDDDPDLHRARLDSLLDEVSKLRGKVVLPTPVIAEFLVRTDEVTGAWLSTLERRSGVQVAPFDRKAALECALLDAAALNKGNKRGGRTDPWQRIKVDRQIVAIARVVGANLLITDDTGMSATARTAGLEVRSLLDLPVPDGARQTRLPLHDGD